MSILHLPHLSVNVAFKLLHKKGAHMARYPSPKPAEVTEVVVQTKALPKKIIVRPVYGRMVHQITALEMIGDTEVPEIDGWLKAQIDAGKVVVV